MFRNKLHQKNIHKHRLFDVKDDIPFDDDGTEDIEIVSQEETPFEAILYEMRQKLRAAIPGEQNCR
jgi:hypothetical protein